MGYMDTAMYTIALRSDLNILTEIRREQKARSKFDLPSWCPDWSLEHGENPMTMLQVNYTSRIMPADAGVDRSLDLKQAGSKACKRRDTPVSLQGRCRHPHDGRTRRCWRARRGLSPYVPLLHGLARAPEVRRTICYRSNALIYQVMEAASEFRFGTPSIPAQRRRASRAGPFGRQGGRFDLCAVRLRIPSASTSI